MTQYLKDLVKLDNQDELYDEIEIERVRLFRAQNLQKYIYILQMYYRLIFIKKSVIN